MDTPLVDAHLDLAYNAIEHGWDLTQPLARLQTSTHSPYLPSVTLPELREAGVAVIFATLFIDPVRYPDPDLARKAARVQLERYHRWQDAGWIRIIERRRDLEAHLKAWRRDRVPGAVLLMEGAGPLTQPEEALDWGRWGVRLLGPAWKDTRYAGGTGGEKGLTPAGRELLAAMTEAGIALDLSHLSEAAFFEALEVFEGPLLVSHANARPLAGGPANRHLSDRQLEALRGRGAVVGIVLYNRFLDPEWTPFTPMPLTRVRDHAEWIAARLSWKAVGIGSDMDGGFGAESLPRGIASHRDWEKLATLFGEHASGVLGENWIAWLKDALPH